MNTTAIQNALNYLNVAVNNARHFAALIKYGSPDIKEKASKHYHIACLQYKTAKSLLDGCIESLPETIEE